MARKARARYLFEKGQAAYQQRRHADAIAHLEEAYGLMQLPALAYNIALTYQAMGDSGSALFWFARYLHEAPEPEERVGVEARIRHHEGVLHAQRIQQLRITTQPAGALVRLDGHGIGLTPLHRELVPGRHRIKLELAGHRSASLEVVLRPERSGDIHAVLEPQPEEPALVAPAQAPVAATAPGPGDPQRQTSGQPTALPGELPAIANADSQIPVSYELETPSSPHPDMSELRREQATGATISPWTLGALAAGGVGMVTAVVFELVRSSSEEALGSTPQVDYTDAWDAMQAEQTAARVALSVGIVGLAAGAVLLTLDLTQKDAGLGPEVTVAPCALVSVCASARGRF